MSTTATTPPPVEATTPTPSGAPIPAPRPRRSSSSKESARTPVAPVWRYEFKYCVPRYVRTALVADLRVLTEPDHHSGPGGFYTVRSLYLDSADWTSVFEKADGLAERHKLRVRGYPDPSGNIRACKFEIKQRRGLRVSKQVAAMDRAEYEQLRPFLTSHRMPGADWLHDRPALLAFFRLKHLHARVPVINIEYRRQAFRARRDRSTRITLDGRLTARRARDLLEPMQPAKPILNASLSVLEIKTGDCLPYWLHQLITKYRLRAEPLSKYARAAATGPFGLDGLF